jgi:hypothetical protein
MVSYGDGDGYRQEHLTANAGEEVPIFGDCLIIYTVLRPARVSFTHMETSPLPVKSCKI